MTRRRSMIVATAGHVDHGKTLLLKALTGVDADRLPEEKRRGLTIDLGFAYTELEQGVSLGFVDVPGHERFIRNMLAGVAGVDYALLVVAADDGPMPQTLEHLAILDLLNVNQGAVAISKIDKVSSDRVQEVAHELQTLLRESSLVGASTFIVSAKDGIGIDALRTHLEEAALSTAERESGGNFRLAIDRSFTVDGAGIVVTGSVFSGSVTVGAQLLVSPLGTPVRVRAIHAQNQASETGFAGQRCSLNIVGRELDKAQISRGDWLVEPPAHAPTNRFDAELRVSRDEQNVIKHWTPAHLHLAATDVTCRIAVLQGGRLAPGESGLVQLVLDRPIGAMRGDRFIVRDQSARRTIGGGTVVDPFSPARGRARQTRIDWLHAMAHPDPEEALGELLRITPQGLDLERFAQAWNLTEAELQRILAVCSCKVVNTVPLWCFSPEHWQTLCESISETVSAWHDEHPEALGPDDNQLKRQLRIKVPQSVLLIATQELIKDNRLKRTGTIVHDPQHVPRVDPADRQLRDSVESIIVGGELRAPLVRELAEQLGLDLEQLKAFLERGTHLGWFVKVTPNRYYTPSGVAALAEAVRSLAEESDDGLFTAGSFRDRTGIGRNLTIEVLEFFDRAGFTRREQSARRVNVKAGRVFQQSA